MVSHKKWFVIHGYTISPWLGELTMVMNQLVYSKVIMVLNELVYSNGY